MKSTLIIILILPFVLLLSCEQYLTEEPYSFLSDANFPENYEDGRIALNGAYSQFQENRIEGYNNTLYDLSDSEITSFGSNTYTGSALQLYQDFKRTTADNFPLWVWTDLYEGINGCNFVIDIAQEKGFDKADLLIAEAKALRAWFYIELTNYFGDVPLRLNSTTSVADVVMPRTGVEEIRQQILQDLNDAEGVMASNPDMFAVHNRGGLLTLGAVKMMKIKLYTFMAGWRRSSDGQMIEGDPTYWTNIRDVCKEIIDMGIYQLEPDYVRFWKDLYIDVYNLESIWEIDFSMPSNGNYASEALTGPGRGAGRAGGYGGLRSTITFYESYDTLDTRRDWTTNWFYFNPGYETYERGAVDARPYIQKFRKIDDAGVYDGRSPQNMTMYRYADLLLTYAEALNETNGGPTPEAYDAINQVRYRARPADHKDDGSVLPDLQDINYDSFKDAIIQERAWELAFEGYRRMDLIRWGLYMEKLQAFPDGLIGMSKAANVRPYHMLLPIPQAEMDINDSWNQNDGW